MSEIKEIVYVDMDGVVADIVDGYNKLPENIREKYTIGHACDVSGLGLFEDLKPIEGCKVAIDKLTSKYDVYFLTTVPFNNPEAYVEKVKWLTNHFPKLKRKMIASRHKNLNMGAYLIDDRTKNGAGEFTGKHIHFGTDDFPTWKEVSEYLGV